MVERTLQSKLRHLATKFPFAAILGPRQSGKSTLAGMAFPDYARVSLEDLDNREFAAADPRGFIATYPDRTIIDEVQRVPTLLSYLQTHADNMRKTGMYILTGSHNLALSDAIDQSLAGRTAILTLLPFSHQEMRDAGIMPASVDEEIFQGSYPRLYDYNIAPTDYYPNYIQTYIERDIRSLKNIGDLAKFTKLIKLCAGRIGQLLNKNSLAVECGVSAPTIDSWLSILEACYIIHFLLPDHRNYSKRLVKSPKLYFCDTGLACSLLEIKSPGQLATHYLRGGLFENMVINEFLKRGYNHGVQPDLSFWRDSSGNEIDLLSGTEEKERLAFEIKSGATFSKEYFKGLNYWSGLSGADSTHKTVIYGGDRSMSTSDGKVSAWKDL